MVGRFDQTVVVDDTDDRDRPVLIPTFSVENNEANAIVSIAAGGWHSLVLLASGSVYSFGSNDAGQLGIGLHTFNQPRLEASASYLEHTIDGLAATLKFVHPQLVCYECEIAAIAAGGQTSIILKAVSGQTDMGDTLASAAAAAPRCPGSPENSTAEIAVAAARAAADLTTRSVNCGVDVASTVFGFGRNDDGQLGAAEGQRVGLQSAMGLGCIDGTGEGSWHVQGDSNASATALGVRCRSPAPPPPLLAPLTSTVSLPERACAAASLQWLPWLSVGTTPSYSQVCDAKGEQPSPTPRRLAAQPAHARPVAWAVGMRALLAEPPRLPTAEPADRGHLLWWATKEHSLWLIPTTMTSSRSASLSERAVQPAKWRRLTALLARSAVQAGHPCRRARCGAMRRRSAPSVQPAVSRRRQRRAARSAPRVASQVP